MTTPKPDWAPEHPHELSYEVLVQSLPHEVLALDVCGSYQGDYLVLLADGERRGFLMIGYGSCSGCDELEAITAYGGQKQDWAPIIAMREELDREIHWEPDAEALAAWLEHQLATSGKGTGWYWFDSEVKDGTRRYIERLRAS